MVLPEASIKMTEKDNNGFHHLWYRYGKCDRPCFSFNPTNKETLQCELFRYLPTGVKLCQK